MLHADSPVFGKYEPEMQEHTCICALVYPFSNWLIIHSFSHSLVHRSQGWRRGEGESEL